MPIRLGTQGWNYDGWLGPFYPVGTRAADYLTLYSRAFDTVEVDSTFYAIPSASSIRSWARRVPAGFTFALKLPKDISHEQRLNDNAGLAPLKSFVLPGGSPAAAQLHVCRTVCRRAERRAVDCGEELNPECVRYLNRLSDLLFILARAANAGDEPLWEPGRFQ